MQTATATVVTEKRLPIAAAAPQPTVVVTTQGLLPYFQEFKRNVRAADKAEEKRSQKKAAQLIACVLDGLNAPTPEQFNKALDGIVAGTRVAGKSADGKATQVDGDDTDAARKFASYCRAIFAAVKSGRMTHEALIGYTNSQALYDAAVKACRASETQPRVDRNGYEVDAGAREAKAKANAAKAARDFAVKRGLTAEQTAALVGTAQAAVEQKRDADAAQRLNDRAIKLAERMIAELGSFDAAEAFVGKVAAIIATRRAEANAVVSTQQ